MKKQNFLDIKDISKKDLEFIIDLAIKIKANPQNYYEKLKHKKMILLLEKSSTRTRISFEFAIKELGGHCSVLNSENTQIARGEPIEDTAKVFDRYADCIVFRTSSHDRLIKISENCNNAIVINALTDKSHPCQIMADIMTIIEQFGSISNRKIAWIGDVNNVLESWIEASEKLDFDIKICCPEILKNKIPASKNSQFVRDKIAAVKDCDIVTTDTWVSMGEEKEKVKLFEGFTVNNDLMKYANKNAIFLHCLPAYRGYEVASDVIDNELYSKIVFDEAENRLHIQKAILLYCFNVI